MSKEYISLAKEFQVSPAELFEAWLNSEKHSLFTGGKAEIKPKKGSHFTAWDGYISGRVAEINENVSLLLSWRTTEFDESDEDSVLEILFSETHCVTIKVSVRSHR